MGRHLTGDGLLEFVDAATGARLHRQEATPTWPAMSPAPRSPNRRQHVVTNLVTDVDGDQAHAHSNGQLLERDDGGHPSSSGFRPRSSWRTLCMTAPTSH